MRIGGVTNGADGEQGPPGATGPAGATGATGPAGPNREFLGLIPGAFTESGFRRNTSQDYTVTTATIAFMKINLFAGETVSSLVYIKGATAATTLTHSWVGLYDSLGNKLAVSNDDTSAWGSSTTREFTLTAPYLTLTAGPYYVGLCIVATTPGNIAGIAGNSALNFVAPAETFRDSATTYSNPASAPASFTMTTALAGKYWIGVKGSSPFV